MRLPLLSLLLLLLPAFGGESVTLTDTKGRAIAVKISNVTDSTVEVIKDGKPFTIKIADLDAPSQAMVARRKAQPPAANAAGAAPTRIRLAAQTTASAKSTDKRWETSWGSYDRTIHRSRFVTVTVSASTPGKAVVECHWIGSDPAKPSNRSVAFVDKTPVDIKAGESISLEFGALFVHDEANYETIDIQIKDGLKYHGWVVRVVSESGETLAVTAARQPLITMIEQN